MAKKSMLSKEKKEGLISEIRTYFLAEREEELGELAAALLLDFIEEKLGPEFYNQGVQDSYILMKDRVEDIMSLEKP
ncbi:MAG: DUF2164 domain-containing protein [Youngiibacter sp.]|nr:DUF2164 domain-containing protein [Youngiibacter sp.]